MLKMDIKCSIPYGATQVLKYVWVSKYEESNNLTIFSTIGNEV